ncbi:M24 family metallopeptidase [Sinorhizobium prairiense]|uniref:M24 family metallopeptidase n=1 Tax=unclassified Sinorhizobium TaxID=2613772 RepID=UPI0023D8875F|nr:MULTISPECIES: Xaa-Pro peptidase family protein [unclassified Sinorhizobium]WEJ08627.1 Xaa-Pro peptidase family protein [Sinorhizobium sp. M103]WEJ13872.1 Xaa-Pro peptidase family protein [Sinorhizobium sp. K101]WEJ35469.1 Xaa-Pro peptidase family protein [Sinorhizobium sp. C101]
MKFEKAFTAEEYRRRVRDVKRRMEEAGLDLLVCQDPANMCWLTGYDAWSFYTPQVVLVHHDSEMPIWVGRLVDVNGARVTTDLPDENILHFPDSLLHHLELHPYDALCDIIKSKGWGSCRIGVELDAHFYTARAHQHMVNGLPNATFLDSRTLVNWARLVKSDAELVYMREAGEIVTSTMHAAIAALRPGVPESDVVAEVYAAQTRGVNGKYGDYTSICPLVQVGEKTNAPHLTWSAEPLPSSGLVSLELGAARRHYHAPLTRTVSIGKPADEVTRLIHAIVEGGDALLAMAKPGVIIDELNSVWLSVLGRYGYTKKTRSGYSIGINFPPDWGERTVSIRAEDKTELQAGMCFHFQSGVRLEGFGAAVSEPFVVTDKGGARLSHVERSLIVVD